MSKRFTDTNKYKKPFIRGLKGPYKLLWDYLYHDCDSAGVWIVDFEIAQLYIGSDMKVTKEEALKQFNNGEKRIIEFDNNKKWFIPSFIEFQYGKLSQTNRAHNSVIQILKKYNLLDKLNKDLISPLEGTMEEDKDKDKEKGRDKVKEEKKDFVDLIIDQFVQAHGSYEVVNKGVERKMAGKLLSIYKKRYPGSSSDDTLSNLRLYFDSCVNISDNWLRNNMCLSLIISHFNQINKLLRNGTNKQVGASEEQLARLLADKLGITE